MKTHTHTHRTELEKLIVHLMDYINLILLKRVQINKPTGWVTHTHALESDSGPIYSVCGRSAL